MKETIYVSIDSNGRAKPSSKILGNQYETGVAEFSIDLSADWQDESYFYYLVVIPPESTGIKQYAVPLTRDFIYLISSNITWYLGTFKFLIIVMNKELDASGQIPTDGVVSISDEWEGEVNKSPLKLAELSEQPENPNFTLLYTDLMALRNSVEQIGNYAQTQGDYAKSVGEALTEDKNNGKFDGKDGTSPIVNVLKENKVTKITIIDANKTETVEVNDGEDGESAGFGTPVVEVETLEAGSAAKATITASGEDAEKVFKFIFGIPRGENGDKGEPGRGVVSIIRTSGTGAPGTYDTYTITYSDNTTSSFQVYNGKDGAGGGTTGDVPTKLSELTNDTGFITNTVDNLVNYYLKTEVYKKDEVNNLISNLTSFSALIVTTLPTENISTTTIYLIANTEQAESNYYDEYLYINNVWEKIGTTQTKLDNYFTKEETIEKIDEAIEGIGTGIQEIPIASVETLGGIKVGKGLEITEEGVLKVENVVVEATGASSNPIGTIIPFIGMIAPQDYLACDGTILNIADYLELATHFKKQFGSINHFGGDGETTFAVPDLRNEFLRGYHNGKEEQLSGEIGIHQDGTHHTRMLVNGNSNLLIFYGDGILSTENADTGIALSDKGRKLTATSYSTSAPSASAYTARPTNVAVLFCIKYTVSSEEIEIEGKITEGSNKIPTSGAVKAYVDDVIIDALGGAY